MDANGAGVVEVRVELGERAYPVLVGSGALGRLTGVLPARAKRIAVVTQARIPLADAVTDALAAAGVDHRVFEIGDGEEHKTLTTVGALCRGFAQWGMTRGDAVVAVGGGLVTDVGGFAAASYLRGIAVVHVATTLLGMVDAAIGGKCGVNLPEGKNLVGAFWQPAAVVCDLDALATLPPRELRCGQGELAKYHFLTGLDLDAMPLAERVAAAAAYKGSVVAADEREALGSSGGRALLNYGHTLAHALETAGGHALAHGEAVAIGLVFAARLARAMGRVDDAAVQRHVDVVGSYGLATEIPAGHDADELLALMARDKKAVDGHPFVLDGPGGIEVVPGVDPAVVRSVLVAHLPG
jgi:5-deoxy-5-amino-3-dehydroquinate synthase